MKNILTLEQELNRLPKVVNIGIVLNGTDVNFFKNFIGLNCIFYEDIKELDTDRCKYIIICTHFSEIVETGLLNVIFGCSSNPSGMLKLYRQVDFVKGFLPFIFVFNSPTESKFFIRTEVEKITSPLRIIFDDNEDCIKSLIQLLKTGILI